ncbi:MAG: hypothetical protein HY438_02060 [DPANN group archaeon]|nr:hypothetical protein [DPANN group archaeon]
MQIGSRAEWDTLRDVIVHGLGMEILFGLLHPRANLYKSTFSRMAAAKEHQKLQDVLTGEGVRVHRVEDALKQNRRCLVELAMACLDFEDETAGKITTTREKERVVRGLDVDDLVAAVYLQPTAVVVRGDGINSSDRVDLYKLWPLTNSYFMRDSFITTDRGIVIGRMATEQREEETEITKAALRAMGIKPIYTMQNNRTEPLSMEGGDFIPAGNICFIGRGLRTTTGAIRQLLSNNCLGSDIVGVVDGPKDMDQMHLDTWFNLPAKDTAIVCGPTLRDANTTVTLYARDGGRYNKITQKPQSFRDYLTKELGYRICEVSDRLQRAHATNILTVKDGKIVVPYVSKEYSRTLTKLGIDIVSDPSEKAKKGLSLENITKGWGGPHCLTNGLLRA